jgi:hypothetical protein
MELLKSGNVILRFLLELCVLAALAYGSGQITAMRPDRVGRHMTANWCSEVS